MTKPTYHRPGRTLSPSSFLRTFLGLMLLLIGPARGNSQPVQIPDGVLRFRLGQLLNRPSGTDITVADLESLQTLSLFGFPDDDDWYPIFSLAGLEHATNLKELTVGSRERVSDLQPLRGLTQLRSLRIPSNRITDLQPLAGLTNLTTLDVGGNTEVGLLDALRGLTQLRDLSAERTGVTDLSPLRELVHLTKLDLDGNLIGEVSSLQTLTGLVELDLDRNRLTDIRPLSALTNLLSLDLDGNDIADLQPLTQLTRLQDLDLLGNLITDVIELTGLTALTNLAISGNPLADIAPLSPLVNLRTLDVRGDELDLTPGTPNHQLITALRARGAEVLTEPQCLADSSSLVPDGRLREVLRARLGQTGSAPLTQGQLATVQNLVLSPSLTPRFLASHRITNLRGLEHCSGLQLLGIQRTAVTDLSPLAALPALLSLSCTEGILSDLSPLSALPLLQELLVTSNRIVNISPLQGLTRLRSLEAQHNEIEDLSPLSGLTGLYRLDLNHNHISDLQALSGLMELDFLDVADNRVSTLAPLAGLVGLLTLDVDENRLISLAPLAGMTQLQSLDAHGNRIIDLAPLERLGSPGANFRVDGNYLAIGPDSETSRIAAGLAARGVSVQLSPQLGIALQVRRSGTGIQLLWNSVSGLRFDLLRQDVLGLSAPTLVRRVEGPSEAIVVDLPAQGGQGYFHLQISEAP